MAFDVKKIALILVFFLGLVACATNYHSAEGGVSGYWEQQLDETTFHVDYTEGKFTSWKEIHEFALKRCAEIASSRGYKYFDVLDKDQLIVHLDSSVDQIIISNSSDGTSNPAVSSAYDIRGKKVEGRRVTYKIKLTNE